MKKYTSMEYDYLRERAIADERNRMEGAKEEGRLEGRLEGKQEGKLEERITLVKFMLRNGMPIKTIQELPGIDEATIQALLREIADELEN